LSALWFNPVPNLNSHPPTKRHQGRRNLRSSLPASADACA